MKKTDWKENGLIGFLLIVGGGTVVAGICLIVIVIAVYALTAFLEGKPLTGVTDEEIESVIQFSGERDEKTVEEIKTELSYLPEKLVAQFIYDDGVILVEDKPMKYEEGSNVLTFTSDGVASADATDEDSVYGACGIKDGQIIIFIVKGHVKDALCHEFGHFLSRYAFDYEIKERFDYLLCGLEKSEIKAELLGDCEYFDKEEEYIAECFRQYIKGNLNVENYPDTVTFFDAVVKSL